MELWCLDDIGRESWDWIVPPTQERAWLNSPVWSSPVKKRSLSRLCDCCCLFEAILSCACMSMAKEYQLAPSEQWHNTWDDSQYQRHQDPTSNWSESEKCSILRFKTHPREESPESETPGDSATPSSDDWELWVMEGSWKITGTIVPADHFHDFFNDLWRQAKSASPARSPLRFAHNPLRWDGHNLLYGEKHSWITSTFFGMICSSGIPRSAPLCNRTHSRGMFFARSRNCSCIWGTVTSAICTTMRSCKMDRVDSSNISSSSSSSSSSSRTIVEKSAQLPRIANDLWHWRSHDLLHDVLLELNVICGTGATTMCSRKIVRLELLFAVCEHAAPSSVAAACHVVAAEASGAEARLYEAVDRLVEHVQRILLLHLLLCLLINLVKLKHDHVRGVMLAYRRDVQRREGHH